MPASDALKDLLLGTKHDPGHHTALHVEIEHHPGSSAVEPRGARTPVAGMGLAMVAGLFNAISENLVASVA